MAVATVESAAGYGSHALGFETESAAANVCRLQAEWSFVVALFNLI